MQTKTDKKLLNAYFDLAARHKLNGSQFTEFVREVGPRLDRKDLALSVGVSRGDIVGPPLDHCELQWRVWIGEGTADRLGINRHTSRCPSMWHQLWPMHRGHGNWQNYIDGTCMPGLLEHPQETYALVFVDRAAGLCIARQWVDSDERAEQGFLSMSCVSDLVFSTSASTTRERWPKAALWRTARPRGPAHKSADWLERRRCPKRFPNPDD